MSTRRLTTRGHGIAQSTRISSLGAPRYERPPLPARGEMVRLSDVVGEQDGSSVARVLDAV